MSFPFQELQVKRRKKILDEEDRRNGIILSIVKMGGNDAETHR